MSRDVYVEYHGKLHLIKHYIYTVMMGHLITNTTRGRGLYKQPDFLFLSDVMTHRKTLDVKIAYPKSCINVKKSVKMNSQNVANLYRQFVHCPLGGGSSSSSSP